MSKRLVSLLAVAAVAGCLSFCGCSAEEAATDLDVPETPEEVVEPMSIGEPMAVEGNGAEGEVVDVSGAEPTKEDPETVDAK